MEKRIRIKIFKYEAVLINTFSNWKYPQLGIWSMRGWFRLHILYLGFRVSKWTEAKEFHYLEKEQGK